MQKITIRQFTEAQKTIKRYREQLLEGKYQFTYWTDKNVKPQIYLANAKSLEEACNIMHAFIKNSRKWIIAVDYVAILKKEGGGYDRILDISGNKILQPYI